MKRDVIHLNTPFNNWSCINTLVHTFWVGFMVFNATFKSISVILWQSVLLVEEFGEPGENHRPAASHWQTSSTNATSSTPRLSRIRIHNVSGDMHWLHIIRVMVFNATFNNISVIYGVSFIDGGNWGTRIKPPTWYMSLTSFITQICIEYSSSWTDWNSQL